MPSITIISPGGGVMVRLRPQMDRDSSPGGMVNTSMQNIDVSLEVCSTPIYPITMLLSMPVPSTRQQEMPRMFWMAC